MQLWLGTEVVSVLPQSGGLVRLELAGGHVGHFDCDFAILCAGLQSDRVAERSGADPEPSASSRSAGPTTGCERLPGIWCGD